MKLLLHTCCAVCATVPIRRLAEEHEITLYFYNPNLFPESEYVRRRDETDRFAAELSVGFIEGPYDHDTWLARIKGHEGDAERGERCMLCYRMRFEAAASVPGFDAFATTLTLSPHKDAEKINALGKEIASAHETSYFESNFKKQNGVLEAREMSQQHGLYRQDYCGCEFSMRKNE